VTRSIARYELLAYTAVTSHLSTIVA